jgi:hypothetical protein
MGADRAEVGREITRVWFVVVALNAERDPRRGFSRILAGPDAAAEPFPHRSPSASLKLGIRDNRSRGMLLGGNELKSEKGIFDLRAANQRENTRIQEI